MRDEGKSKSEWSAEDGESRDGEDVDALKEVFGSESEGIVVGRSEGSDGEILAYRGMISRV